MIGRWLVAMGLAAAASAPPAWTPPRTPDGRPDLQGFWTNARCIVWGNEGPPMLPPGYNSFLQIVQTPASVAIMQEMIHDVRIIPLDGRPHAPANVRRWLGDSRGRWEGDTLVVDTTNFTD